MSIASRAPVLLPICTILLAAQATLPEVSINTHGYTPPSTLLHVESNLVEAGLTVRDSNGHTVAGLHASDFEVLDNGAFRQITGFSELRLDHRLTGPVPAASAESPDAVPPATTDPSQPRFIAFFFDDLHTFDLNNAGVTKVPAGVAFMKQAAHAFIDKGLAPTDWLSIATASGEGELDFTNDASLFAEKFAGLRSRAYAVSWAAYQTQTENMIAALGSVAERLSKRRGRRLLLVISHGFPNRIGRLEFERFMDTALRFNITVHAIYAKGLDVTPPELPPKQIIAWENARWFNSPPLQEMAERTGGHLFKDTNDFGGAMEQAIYPDVSYLVAFRPGSPDGKFHTLKIRLKSNPEDSLEYRQSYFSRKDDLGRELAGRRPLDDAVFSGQSLQDIPALVTLSGGQPKDGMIPVSVKINLDVNRIQFTRSHGRHMQQIVFLVTLLDSTGAFVTGKESIMELALTDAKLVSLRKDGLKAVATLNAPLGIYQVRTVVREGVKGGLAASTTAVQLRAK